VPRPRSVTLVALAVLGLAAYNLLGALSAIQRYTVLSALPLGLPAAYLLASSAVWAALLGTLVAGLWRLKEWARRGTLLALTLYVALGWLERLLLARSEFAEVSAPFVVAFQGAWLLLVWLALLRRSARQSFSA
jgi:hypothetical protein